MWLNQNMIIRLRVVVSLQLRGETAAGLPESVWTQPRTMPAMIALTKDLSRRGRGEASLTETRFCPDVACVPSSPSANLRQLHFTPLDMRNCNSSSGLAPYRPSCLPFAFISTVTADLGAVQTLADNAVQTTFEVHTLFRLALRSSIIFWVHYC